MQRGFTLLEMVVVLAIVSASLFLAAGMLQESGALLAGAGRTVRDPLSSVVMIRLRRDVQEADAVAGSPWSGTGWTGTELRLTGVFPDTLVSYERTGDRLERVLRDSSTGDVLSREPRLHGVVGWRWRQLSSRLVDVEVTYRRAPDLSSYRMDGNPGPAPSDVLEVERLRLTLRGRGEGVGW